MKFTTAMRSPITSCASRTRFPPGSRSGTSLSATFAGSARPPRRVVMRVMRQQSARDEQTPSTDPLKDPRRA